MNHLSFAGVAVLALSGCANLPSGTAEARNYVVDQQKMAVVERAASKTGAKVIWVSAPRRPATSTGG